MSYRIEKIHLIRNVEGRDVNRWMFTVDHIVNDLEAYRKHVKERYKATTVLFTYATQQ